MYLVIYSTRFGPYAAEVYQSRQTAQDAITLCAGGYDTYVFSWDGDHTSAVAEDFWESLRKPTV